MVFGGFDIYNKGPKKEQIHEPAFTPGGTLTSTYRLAVTINVELIGKFEQLCLIPPSI